MFYPIERGTIMRKKNTVAKGSSEETEKLALALYDASMQYQKKQITSVVKMREKNVHNELSIAVKNTAGAIINTLNEDAEMIAQKNNFLKAFTRALVSYLRSNGSTSYLHKVMSVCREFKLDVKTPIDDPNFQQVYDECLLGFVNAAKSERTYDGGKPMEKTENNQDKGLIQSRELHDICEKGNIFKNFKS